MNVSFFQELFGSIAERGRALIERSPDRQMANGRKALVPGAAGAAAPETLEGLCRALLSGRGEASGVALARRVLDLYAPLPVGDGALAASGEMPPSIPSPLKNLSGPARESSPAAWARSASAACGEFGGCSNASLQFHRS